MKHSRSKQELAEMILRDYGSIMILVIVAMIALSGIISSYVNGPDKEYEQAVEDIIRRQTGIHVDLSPG